MSYDAETQQRALHELGTAIILASDTCGTVLPIGVEADPADLPTYFLTIQAFADLWYRYRKLIDSANVSNATQTVLTLLGLGDRQEFLDRLSDRGSGAFRAALEDIEIILIPDHIGDALGLAEPVIEQWNFMGTPDITLFVLPRIRRPTGP